VLERLVDAPRPGTPLTFTPEQIRSNLALGCEPPRRNELDPAHCRHADLAAAAVARGIVQAVSADSVRRFLREADLKAHRTSGWINTPRDEHFIVKCHDVCETYRLAPEHTAAGIETRSIDEMMTGVQELRRTATTLAGRPGLAGRRQFEYIRHDTLTLVAAFDMVKGQVTYRLGPRRTGQDFVANVAELLAHRDDATR